MIALLTAGTEAKETFASTCLKFDQDTSRKLVAVVHARAGAVLSDRIAGTAIVSSPNHDATESPEPDMNNTAAQDLSETQLQH